MTTPLGAFLAARSAGVRMTATGGRLLLAADGRPAEGLLDALREHKAGILELLAAPAPCVPGPRGWLPEELVRRRIVEAGGSVVANRREGRHARLIAWAEAAVLGGEPQVPVTPRRSDDACRQPPPRCRSLSRAKAQSRFVRASSA